MRPGTYCGSEWMAAMERLAYKEVGLRIRCLREANNYTREMLAEKLDISSKFLYEIEMGKKGFTVEILYHLAKVFSVSSDYLLTGGEGEGIPRRIADLLAQFKPEQMGYIQEMLSLLYEMKGGPVN